MTLGERPFSCKNCKKARRLPNDTSKGRDIKMRKARNVLKWVEWAMAVEGLCALSMCFQAA